MGRGGGSLRLQRTFKWRVRSCIFDTSVLPSCRTSKIVGQENRDTSAVKIRRLMTHNKCDPCTIFQRNCVTPDRDSRSKLTCFLRFAWIHPDWSPLPPYTTIVRNVHAPWNSHHKLNGLPKVSKICLVKGKLITETLENMRVDFGVLSAIKWGAIWCLSTCIH
jgi:hypothetical protein